MKQKYFFDLQIALCCLFVFFLIGTTSFVAQETGQDSTATNTGISLGRIELKDPASIVSKYTYDPVLDRYVYTEQLGSFDITYPLILTPEEFERRLRLEQMDKYFQDKISSLDGRTVESDDGPRNILPNFYVNSDFFETIFGGTEIEFIPQGSVEVDLGLLFTRQDNPALSPRNRSNISFDFDQRISLSLLGKVGERLQINANFDTESTFNFQNQIKLEYTPTEDDIIQKIEVGNVNLPLNSALIQGSQSLFGVKTELQFGKTRITAAFAENRSQPNTVTAENGATVQDFEIFSLDYDEDRHFFLAHFFRDDYDRALTRFPFVDNNFQITRLEVWVTNRQNQTQDVRNIVGIQDLGESDPSNIGIDLITQPGFLNQPASAFPDNANNDFNPFGINNPQEQSVLTEAIRDIATVQDGFGGAQVTDGLDFALMENARQLLPNEFQLNTQLGYISLNQRLSNDEVLGVAFQYTVNGEVFQVGEFANDGVDATVGERADTDGDGVPDEFDSDPDGDGVDQLPDQDDDDIADQFDADVNDDGVNNGIDVNGDGILDSVLPLGQGAGAPQNLVVKMLKSNITNVEEPIWDLMMKNIYPLGAFNLEQEGFRLNVVYADPSPVNFIEPAPGGDALPIGIANTTLLQVFNLDRLTTFGDPQTGGDGFFDFVPGITVNVQNGNMIFTSVEPFGERLFNQLNDGDPTRDYFDRNTYNANQFQYVYTSLYRSTKIVARDNAERNKFALRGRYRSTQEQGIPIGAFNVPQGSVTVTAGGRVLTEGLDYTVNYQIGRVIILDPALEASGIPITVSVENNATFGQQNRRFTGINVEHQFSENFLVGATFLNLNERPLTQKATFDFEPINNTIFGVNASYSTEVPLLTRLINKWPTIDTDASSNISVRGEAAFLIPGQPRGTDFNGEATSFIDDFEGAQTNIDISSPQQWQLASIPIGFRSNEESLGNPAATPPVGIQTGFRRSRLAWYTIDPTFYTAARPAEISDDDLSTPFTRRVFRDEIFPNQDILSGQTQALFPLDLAYFPAERGPYNYNPNVADEVVDNPQENFGGIMRQFTSTDFEQSNVEFVEFWLLDPYFADGNTTDPGGKLVINLGNISEDILTDGRKQYENGLPAEGGGEGTTPTVWGRVPTQQSLIYAFDTEGQQRTNQDVGLDGLNDQEEADMFEDFAGLEDPAGDNYEFFLAAEGDVIERYDRFNGQQGNSPVDVGQTDRGATQFPDIEDINRDNTTSTIDAYFEYEIEINPQTLNTENEFVNDVRELQVEVQNGETINTRWLQFRIPIDQADRAVNGISDLRSIRFMRMFLTDFQDDIILRMATLDLVRGDFRRYLLTLDPNEDTEVNNADNTQFEVANVNIEANETREPIPYVLPPGVVRERINNNNNNIRQNEQSLSIQVDGLENQDARGVFKNFNLDLRQYRTLRMFLHAEALTPQGLDNDQVVAFVRFGTDLNSNFYQIEIPLDDTDFGSTAASDIWPVQNELNMPLELLQQIKSQLGAIGGPVEVNLADDVNFPDQIAYFDENAEFIPNPLNTEYEVGQIRVGIRGIPSFGDIRQVMFGVKNGNTIDGGVNPLGTEVWFNEFRVSELNNQGGWAGVLNFDGNIADFANISSTGRISTEGFGTIEQAPNERSRENVVQYDLVANVNAGQLFPKKWGLQLPVNLALGEQLITPQFDAQFTDLLLDQRIDNAATPEDAESIRRQSEDYTRRQSINLIGVRKERTNTERRPKPYDIENFAFSYSYNQTDHRDFEIEESRDQGVSLGGTYSYSFNPKPIEPFKKNDSLFTGKYWKWLKDTNFNYLPNSVNVSSNINRQFSRQRFRDLLASENDIPVPTLFQRNFLFDWQYSINYPITNSLRVNFDSSHNRIVRNFLDQDGLPLFLDENNNEIDGFGIYNGFFNLGEPNTHFQTLQLNYDLPFDKIPFLAWISGTYSYASNFRWQRGSQQFEVLPDIPDLGNTIENGNTHTFNGTLELDNLYRYLKLTKKTKRTARANTRADRSRGVPSAEDDGRGALRGAARAGARSEVTGRNAQGSTKGLSSGAKAYNGLIAIVTALKQVQINYQETNGTFIPGFLPSIGFAGTLRPTTGFVFGSQADVRDIAARNGFLTSFQNFNQQIREVTNRQLTIQARIGILKDLDIDVNFNRTFQENFTENFRINDNAGDLQFESLTPNAFGNFNISTLLIGSAFNRSTQESSEVFDQFRENRLATANRLAANFFGTTNFDRDENGFPEGFGRNNQAVLLPAFLAAYAGGDAEDNSLGFLRDIPLPNWNIRYSGLMNLKWFRKNFRRFSLQHAYSASYTVNQFNTNLAFDADIDNNPLTAQRDQSGNFLNPTLLGGVTLTEQFTPLIRVDFEAKNSINVLAEIRRNRMLSLSFDNNILTELQGDEYIVGLGYRIKDLTFASNFGGKRTILKSDLNLRADLSLRRNETILRFLDSDTNQTTAGQDIYGLRFTADYALSQNLTALFFYDHTFSTFAISTAFPQTTVRSGFTLRYLFGN